MPAVGPAAGSRQMERTRRWVNLTHPNAAFVQLEAGAAGGREAGAPGEIAVLLDVRQHPAPPQQLRHRVGVGVVVLDPEPATVPQQRRRRRHDRPDDLQAVGAAEDRARRIEGRPPPAAPACRRGRTAGCTAPGRHGSRARAAGPASARPRRAARPACPRLRRAPRRCAGPTTAPRGPRRRHARRRPAGTPATPRASAPDPVHRSTTSGDVTSAIAFRPHSSSSSVSGRGVNTPDPTARVTGPNTAVPRRCCSGSRAARRATNSR